MIHDPNLPYQPPEPPRNQALGCLLLVAALVAVWAIFGMTVWELTHGG